MRSVAITLAVLALAACSAPATEEDPEPSSSRTSAPVESGPAAVESTEPTFWDLAPLGNGQHIRVHIDDRARAQDCDELAAEFERWVEDDAVEGFTHDVLAYIEAQSRAAGCAS